MRLKRMASLGLSVVTAAIARARGSTKLVKKMCQETGIKNIEISLVNLVPVEFSLKLFFFHRLP